MRRPAQVERRAVFPIGTADGGRRRANGGFTHDLGNSRRLPELPLQPLLPSVRFTDSAFAGGRFRREAVQGLGQRVGLTVAALYERRISGGHRPPLQCCYFLRYSLKSTMQ